MNAIGLEDATAALQERRYADAVVKMNVAIELDPNRGHFRFLRGIAYFLMGGNDNMAIKDFGAAIMLDDPEPDPWFYRGLIYYRRGEYEKARQDLDKYVSVMPVTVQPLLMETAFLMLIGSGNEALTANSGPYILENSVWYDPDANESLVFHFVDESHFQSGIKYPETVISEQGIRNTVVENGVYTRIGNNTFEAQYRNIEGESRIVVNGDSLLFGVNLYKRYRD
jgi:tetratricopeptide (TPR) repeat protein